MTQVTILQQGEGPCIDDDLLDALYQQLGTRAAEHLVANAVDELAVSLSVANDCYAAANTPDLRRTVVELGHVADQIGLTGLSLVANHVIRTIDQADGVALAATMARLFRVGESSLSAIWDEQNA